MSRDGEKRPTPEETELEKRILAHEHILQSLVAYMSETEPRFVDHLRAQFVEPMAMARHEQDFLDTNDYAEDFVRQIIRLGEKSRRTLATVRTKSARDRCAPSSRQPEMGPSLADRTDRTQLTERNGVWELRVDGVFRGDYFRKEHGVAAAAKARGVLVSGGVNRDAPDGVASPNPAFSRDLAS